MTTPATPAKRPARGWYVVAAALAVVAAAILVVLAVWIGRAVAGYSVTPFEQGGTTTVTVGERGVAIWISPQNATTHCVSNDVDTQESSLNFASATKVTMTDGGHTWKRAGIVKGEPGSKHLVECDASGGQEFGYADNPRISRYLTYGVVGGVLAGLAAIGAFVIALVTGIKRNRKPSPA
jgi:hypothetical protein